VSRRPALWALALLATFAVATAARAESFTFDRCNRTWRASADRLPAMTQGPLTLHFSSPDAALDVEDHRLDLTPLADGTHRARFEALFTGAATLNVDVEVNGAVSRMQDDVRVPPQRRVVEGRVQLAKGVGEDGTAVYEMTVVEMPKTVPVVIESNLAGRLGSMCDGFALLLPLDCGLVRAAMSRVNVPMPEPGETYLLPPECLDPAVARRLDDYLAVSAR
jgi:hypothetical protein